MTYIANSLLRFFSSMNNEKQVAKPIFYARQITNLINSFYTFITHEERERERERYEYKLTREPVITFMKDNLH